MEKDQEQKGPELGKVFVKEFFIVGVAIKALPGCFAVCGDGGEETSSSVQDALYPCMGTDRAKAEAQFERAKVAYEKECGVGAVVLIKFTGGIIEKIAEYKCEDQTTIQA